jgi:hypothetical protein
MPAADGNPGNADQFAKPGVGEAKFALGFGYDFLVIRHS